jgi:hypothetical protein
VKTSLWRHTAQPLPYWDIHTVAAVRLRRSGKKSRGHGRQLSSSRSIPTLSSSRTVARVVTSPARLDCDSIQSLYSSRVRVLSIWPSLTRKRLHHTVRTPFSWRQQFSSFRRGLPLITLRISTYDPAGLSEMNVLSHGAKLGGCHSISVYESNGEAHYAWQHSY